jgi:hypothetical protein
MAVRFSERSKGKKGLAQNSANPSVLWRALWGSNLASLNLWLLMAPNARISFF